MSQYSGKHQVYSVDSCWPTKALLDKWAAEDKNLKEFEVTYFTVCHDTMQDGRRLIHAPLSARYSTKEKADIALQELHEHYPDAYVMQSRLPFNPLRDSDHVERQSILSTIR